MAIDQDTMKAITQRMKQRRLELGYSYQDLANLTGMSKSTLQRYETGAISNLPLHRLRTIATALNVDPEWLLGWKKDEAKAEVGNGMLMRPLHAIHLEDIDYDRIYEAVAKAAAATGQTDDFILLDEDPQIDRILASVSQLNTQGLTRLKDYAEDLVASGKYQKEKPSEEG